MRVSTCYVWEQLNSYFTLNAGLVNHLINLIGGDSRLQRGRRKIQNLARKTTYATHALLLLLVQNLDTMLAKHALLGARNAIAGVIGVRNRLRNSSLGRKWVERSQVTGEWICRERIEVAGGWIRFRNYLRREEVGEGITFFMDGLVLALDKRSANKSDNRRAAYEALVESHQCAYPAPLETVLRTEETVVAHLQTGGTLQGTGILVTVHTNAFASLGSSHGDHKRANEAKCRVVKFRPGNSTCKRNRSPRRDTLVSIGTSGTR